MTDFANNEDMESRSLFLRDAGIFLDSDEYGFLKRLNRCIRLAEKNGLAIQITLNDEFFLESHERLEHQLTGGLLRFDSVLIHLHSNYLNKFGSNTFTDKSIVILKRLFQQCKNIDGLCVHPDLIDDFSSLDKFIIDDNYIGIEILDETVDFGNHFSEMDKILKEYNFLSLILDTAHIQQMQKNGEPDLNNYLDFFGDRIKEIHFSQNGNYYDMNQMKSNFDTSHSLFALTWGDTGRILSDVTIPKDINYVIEGVIPNGKYGEGLLNKEVTILKSICHTNCDLCRSGSTS